MIYPGRRPVGYSELADILRVQITDGRLKPGQRLPSEAFLAQSYGVASKTARAAIKLLRDEGLAVSVRGYGVVVREPVESEPVHADVDDRISGRMPSPRERDSLDVPEGVPLLVVTHPDGSQDLYPADRYHVTFRRR
ncbi:winged helix-turn-helix domain-containing protein [Micromonospora sp. SH-82]|uniref:winged helix-turn-helix domain-containing protein n=1 Tax=Micromonospora sp. SH-82 TaxID=3132938 RepID=UPI003EBC2943